MSTFSISEEKLNDAAWKDPFDDLLTKRSLLRELNVIKDNVRISFNNDSSIEASHEHISNKCSSDDNRNLTKNGSRSISTPLLIKKNCGPFDCPLSPISSWQINNFNQQLEWESSCKEKSILSEKVNSSCQQLFPKTIHFIQNLNENEHLVKSLSTSSFGNIETGKSYTKTSEIQEVVSSGNRVDGCQNVVLLPGKWRRSLTVWKRLNKIKNDGLVQNIQTKPSLSLPTQYALAQRRSKLELLSLCEQKTIEHFSSVYTDFLFRKSKKIGEGTYAEVYLRTSECGKTVIKIIPIEGSIDVNGEPQKSFEQILPEVIISKELSNLRDNISFSTTGFIYLENVRCLKGKYPEHFIELWNLYEKNYGSENDHPRIFKDDQLYVALEIAYGGIDLEKFSFRNSEQAYAVFLQISISLAVAEKSLQFEHRDLHCGNILIQETDQKIVEFTMNNKKIKIQTRGVKATIIDYTLSRISTGTRCYFNDLSSDDDLFSAKGDYQYDIYRLMRAKVGNDWKLHEPKTNIMWLHYILVKLINRVSYRYCRSKQHLTYMNRIKHIEKTVMQFSSAFEFVDKILNQYH